MINAADIQLVGKSAAMDRVFRFMHKVKDTDAPVFIWGESGTGKELVARNIHFMGTRRRGKFIALNCSAIPENLLESELFGHVRGSFTGAVCDKVGLVEEASEGTLFLDEIADLSLPLQAKLLRFLEGKEFRRVGENRMRRVDVRFISATNKIIEEEVRKGGFREDLYYRLKILTVELLPLRARQEDLSYLLDHFLDKYCRELNRGKVSISPSAQELLLSYPWPGNVRELQSEILRCLIFCEHSDVIQDKDLSMKINPAREISRDQTYDFVRAKAAFERRYIRQALTRCNYNRARTAEEIGLSRQGLFKLIKKHRIEIPGKVSREKEEAANGARR